MFSRATITLGIGPHSSYHFIQRFDTVGRVTGRTSSTKLVRCGTDGRLLLSGFQALVTFTLDRVIRHIAVHHSLTSIYIRNFIEIGKNIFPAGLTTRTPPSSRSRDTKSRENIKNLACSNLDIVL